MCDKQNELGKFEAEPCYAEEIYEMILDGCADETIDNDEVAESSPVDFIVIDDEFRSKHGIDSTVHAISGWTSDNGFFWTDELTKEEFEKVIAAQEGR